MCRRVAFYDDASYNFEIIRTLSHAVNGAADINECMNVAENVSAGDGEAWYREFMNLAERVEIFGNQCESRGHLLSAYSSYLRASNYYRMADFYIHANPSDERIKDCSRHAIVAFKKAAPGFRHPMECFQIPYEKNRMPAYFLKGGKPGTKAPVFIIFNGFDGNKEESIYGNHGFAAADRGYHVLAVDGPGQGEFLREQNHYFRPDYEAVVTPVVDYLYTREDVDTDRIALMGVSLGGLLVGSAAAHENRIKALIANSGLTSTKTYVDLAFPKIGELAYSDPARCNELSRKIAENDSGKRWALENGRFVFGAEDNAGFIRKYLELGFDDAHKITATTLVLDSDGEHFFPGCAEEMYNQLTCPKTLMVMTKRECVQFHCQAGGELYGGQLILNWLDEIFRS